MKTASNRLSKGFRVLPTDVPNKGIRFVDHEKDGRSGHAGNCLTECRNGDIVAFYSNCRVRSVISIFCTGAAAATIGTGVI